MISPERLQELIECHEQNLRQTDAIGDILGGGPFVEVTKKITKGLLTDTISALKEYSNMASVREMIDGG